VLQALILALTLRGPSGGHCVGLSFGLRSTLGKQAVGPSGPLLGIEIGDWPYLKLHAVAPGGPPEGQCKKEPEKWSVTPTTTTVLLPYNAEG
jgi:hypothetical protein